MRHEIQQAPLTDDEKDLLEIERACNKTLNLIPISWANLPRFASLFHLDIDSTTVTLSILTATLAEAALLDTHARGGQSKSKMSHARIEEVSDSDPEIDDPSNYLPDSDNQIIRPAYQSSPAPSAQPAPQASRSNPDLFRPPIPQEDVQRQTPKAVKQYQCIYPIYFDSTRSKSQGRRVSKDLAIPNPLAWQVLSAIRATVGENVLRMAFEPEKTHPKDWANPGRIKIQLKDTANDNTPLHKDIKSKAHLYTVIGKWLKEHPTTKQTPLDLRLPGLPIPENFGDEIPVPRGWKMGKVLPVHSNAVSGGGVRDNFLKEAMEEMEAARKAGHIPDGGPGGGGMPDMAALQNMMSSMGGMGGLGNMLGLGGGGGGSSGGGEASGKKKKDKKKG
jgi:signal recognition particle subunit SRP19